MSDQDVTDDWALLRGIERLESGVDDKDNALYSHVMSKPGFQVLRENEHLCSLLKSLLELNIAVRYKRREGSKRSALGRMFRQAKLMDYQSTLDALVLQRDEAFNKYEMLRRLVGYENTFLFRPKS